jgi:mannosyltransferase
MVAAGRPFAAPISLHFCCNGLAPGLRNAPRRAGGTRRLRDCDPLPVNASLAEPKDAPSQATASGARRSVWLAVAALTVLGAVLRFYRLGHQGFWFDEGNTALLVHFPPGKMLGLIPQTESTPPLYYMAAWVWARIFGDNEAGLRSLSALAGVLVIPVAYATAAKLAGRRTGLIVAALTACSPLLIWYSQEARSYEVLVLLCALSLMAFAYARDEPSPPWLAAWVIASVLALTTHYYAVVAIAPEAAWLLYERRRARSVQVAVALVTVCGLALIPLALSQNSTGHDSWIANSPLGLRLAQIIPQFLIGTGSPARALVKFAASAAALAALVLLFAGRRARERRPGLLAGGLALAGFLLSLLFIAARSDALITRNIIALWLPAAILVGAGLAAARPRALGLALTAVLCGIGLVATIGIAVDYDLQRPDWRPVAQLLGPAPPGGRAILIQHYRTLLPLSLYMPDLHFWRGNERQRVGELDVIAISSPQQPLCWWGAACNLIPSQLQSSYSIPGFHEVSVRHVHRFTIMRLVSDRPPALARQQVAAALYTTHLRHDDLLVQRSSAG